LIGFKNIYICVILVICVLFYSFRYLKLNTFFVFFSVFSYIPLYTHYLYKNRQAAAQLKATAQQRTLFIQKQNGTKNINSVTRGQGVSASQQQNKQPRQQQISNTNSNSSNGGKGDGVIRSASSTGATNSSGIGNETPRTRERNAKRSLAPPVTMAEKQYSERTGGSRGVNGGGGMQQQQVCILFFLY